MCPELLQGVDRDVDRKHVAVGADPLDGAERQQSDSGTDIGNCFGAFDLSSVEHAVPFPAELLERLPHLLIRPAGEARPDEPLGPLVELTAQRRKKVKSR
jgi:hypothetical protein